MDKHSISPLTRRAFLAGLALVPTVALAHPGHGAAKITVDAQVLSSTSTTVTLVLQLLNLGSTPITLFGVGAKGADTVTLARPVEIAGFGGENVDVILTFQGEVPGIFTVTMDFGEHGQGPVVVMP